MFAGIGTQPGSTEDVTVTPSYPQPEAPQICWAPPLSPCCAEQDLPLVDQLPLQGVHEISRGCGPATVQNHFKPGNETEPSL